MDFTSDVSTSWQNERHIQKNSLGGLPISTERRGYPDANRNALTLTGKSHCVWRVQELTSVQTSVSDNPQNVWLFLRTRETAW